MSSSRCQPPAPPALLPLHQQGRSTVQRVPAARCCSGCPCPAAGQQLRTARCRPLPQGLATLLAAAPHAPRPPDAVAAACPTSAAWTTAAGRCRWLPLQMALQGKRRPGRPGPKQQRCRPCHVCAQPQRLLLLLLQRRPRLTWRLKWLMRCDGGAGCCRLSLHGTGPQPGRRMVCNVRVGWHRRSPPLSDCPEGTCLALPARTPTRLCSA